jgi:hypothetical protein
VDDGRNAWKYLIKKLRQEATCEIEKLKLEHKFRRV